MWDAASGQELTTLNAHTIAVYGAVYSVAFSPDGTRIASGSADKTIKVWDAASGQELTTLSGHTSRVNSVAFSPDGTRVYSKSVDSKKIVWDSKTGESFENEEWVEIKDDKNVTPDGRWLVTSEGKNVLIVDLEYKNTPREKAYRQAKARSKPFWHLDQAQKAEQKGNWFAATFHRAWVMKSDPEQAVNSDLLHRAYKELKKEFAKQSEADGKKSGQNLNNYQLPVIVKMLELPRGKTHLPLARFRFDGDGVSTGLKPVSFNLKNTEFRDDKLYLNGKYEHSEGKTGYRAVCQTPNFSYKAFSVAVKFKAEKFNSVVLVAGTGFRWFALRRARSGNLAISFNNGRLFREIKNVPLKKGVWTNLACGVDLNAKKVVAYIDGNKVTEFDLPRDFKLDLAGESKARQNREKNWTFTNYASGDSFHGLVDELIIFNRMLSDEEFKNTLPVEATRLPPPVKEMVELLRDEFKLSSELPEAQAKHPLARFRFDGNGKSTGQSFREELKTRVVPVSKMRTETKTRQLPDGTSETYQVQVPYTENVTQAYSVKVPNTESVSFDLKNTEFKNGKLYLNGEYEHGKDKSGYRAVCPTPNLTYKTFSVAVKLKAEKFNSVVLVAGTGYRWFALRRARSGNLAITFNNGDFIREIENAPLKEGVWVSLACGVDLKAKKVVAYVDGSKVAEFDLPNDFELRLAGATRAEQNREKEWTFTNYSSGSCFHGLVDELIIHNRILSDEEFKNTLPIISMTQAKQINDEVWKEVKVLPIPGAPLLPQASVLDLYRNMVQQYPRGIYYNTLAAAEYRRSNFKNAIAASLKSVELTQKELKIPTPHPVDYAILAMSHFKLDELEKASEYREKLDQAIKLDVFKDDEECKSFATEVNSLFDSK